MIAPRRKQYFINKDQSLMFFFFLGIFNVMDNGPSFHAEKKRCAEMATFYNFLTLRSTTLDKFIDLCELLGCSFVAERDL